MSFYLNIEQVRALRALASALDYADRVELTERIDVSPFKPRIIEDARKVVGEADALVRYPILTQSSDLPVKVCQEGQWIPDSVIWDSTLVLDLIARFDGPVDANSGDPRRFGGNLALYLPANELGILQEVATGDCECGTQHSKDCISSWGEHIRELQSQFTASTLFLGQDQAGMAGNIVIGAFTPLLFDAETYRFEDPYGSDGETIDALMAAMTYRVLPAPMETPATPLSVAYGTVDPLAIQLDW